MDPFDGRVELQGGGLVRHSKADRQMIARSHCRGTHDFRATQRDVQYNAQPIAVNGGPAF